MAKKIATVQEVVGEQKTGGLVALADFVLDGSEYKAGEEVVLPKKYQRDSQFEELRNLDRIKGAASGLAFKYEYDTGFKDENKNPIVDVRRVILPLKEV